MLAMSTIYKILPAAMWADAQAEGVFTGAPVDTADGFIHFSTATQVQETAEKHFKGQENLILLAVDAEKLGPALKWEPSRGGALFPHLYDKLRISVIKWSRELAMGAGGLHVFPALEE